MAKPPRGNDLFNLLRGLTKVGSAAAEIRSEEARRVWGSLPIRPIVEGGSRTIQDAIVKAVANPSTIQDVAKKGASEVAGRFSMVTSGIKAWSFDTKGMPGKTDEAYDPLLDPNVEQVYPDSFDIKGSVGDTRTSTGMGGLDFGTAMVEDNLSMKSSSAAALENLDVLASKGSEAFVAVQEHAQEVQGQVGAAVDHQITQFESLLDPEGQEVEITEEHLDALNSKLSEIQDIAYGHDLKIFKEAEPAKPAEEVLTAHVKEQERNIATAAGMGGLDFGTALVEENLSMQSSSAAALENLDALASEGTEAFVAVQELAQEAQNQVEAAVDQRLSQFESLLDPEQKEVEITEEHLDALSEKLSEIQNVAYGHDLKMFKEVEPARPVEEVVIDLVKDQERDTEMIASMGGLDFGTSLVEENLSMQSSSATALENLDALASEGTEAFVAVQELAQEAQGQAEAAGTSGLVFGTSMVEENLSMEVSSAAALENLDVLTFEGSERVDATQEDQVNQQMQFESLIGSEQKEVEITEEHIDAITKELSEIQDVAYGHNLKIFQEMESSIPEVLQDKVKDEVVQGEGKKSLSEEETITQHLDKTSSHIGKEEMASNGDAEFELTRDNAKVTSSVNEEPILSKSDDSMVEAIQSESSSNLGGEANEVKNTEVGSSEVTDGVKEVSSVDLRDTQTLSSLGAMESFQTRQEFAVSPASNWRESPSTQSPDLVQHGKQDFQSSQHFGFRAAAKPIVPEHSEANEILSEIVSETSVEMTETTKEKSAKSVQETDAVKAAGGTTEDMNVTAAESVKKTVTTKPIQETVEGAEAVKESAGTAEVIMETAGAEEAQVAKEAEAAAAAAAQAAKEAEAAAQAAKEAEAAAQAAKEAEAAAAAQAAKEEEAAREAAAAQAAKEAEAAAQAAKEAEAAAAAQAAKEAEAAAAAQAAKEAEAAAAAQAAKEAEAAAAAQAAKEAEAAAAAQAAKEAEAAAAAQAAKEAEAAAAAAQAAKEAEAAAAAQAAKEAEAAAQAAKEAEAAAAAQAAKEAEAAAAAQAAKEAEAAAAAQAAKEAEAAAAAQAAKEAEAAAAAQAAKEAEAEAAKVAAAAVSGAAVAGAVLQSAASEGKSKPKPKLLGRKPLAKDKPKSTLAKNAQARKVPHSRIGRLMTFGGLAASLGAGTVAEMTRRTLGYRDGKGSGSLLDASPFLTEANAKRIVDTLCRVRGAALKLGQMLSIQDNALINPQLQKIFERVRQSADFMPAWQLENALVKEFGPDWRTRVSSFDDHPFAAASIGQVHLATLEDGRQVAMKIQYPGVADGIESDINNLISTLRVANILPEALYVDSVIEVAKKELAWECDYEREYRCTKRFKELVQPYPEFYVPEVIDELSTKQVFTTELIEGVAVDKCVDMDQETRNFVCEQVLRLCLMELFQFGFMQTDPNWANFFYNADTRQVALLDFGACREYDKGFVDKYIRVINGAAQKDRDTVVEYSKQLGFLTGHEAKVMESAHVDAVMILGEAFQENKPFNFGEQNTTQRIQQLIPVMLAHRMCPPPEESYSLHRKMSGVFLLCAKLQGRVNCKPLFDDLWNRYKFGGTWADMHGQGV
ncbi:uncharacterized protein LOC143040365 isoform X2 [Oratosquilla oratoria]|uniref:uncharacterized protein LOC143040365 isoform X2 n=1 Tax=Oratosquilla oratoria TaxID=337810 RepID=UPI003F76DB86